MRHYEDLVVGEQRRFGRYEVTRDEVVDFARRFDPQPFHLSEEAAAATHFGRLAASGWHTCAMYMAMNVAHGREEPTAWLGGQGIDRMRWIRPVYPGDVLRVETELTGKRRLPHRPEMGIATIAAIVFNQDDEPVLAMTVNAIIAVRDPATADPAN